MFVFKLGGFRLNKVGFSPWQSRLFTSTKSDFSFRNSAIFGGKGNNNIMYAYARNQKTRHFFVKLWEIIAVFPLYLHPKTKTVY